MIGKLGSVPNVVSASNRPTTERLWVFALQQEGLNMVLETKPSNALARWEKEVPGMLRASAWNGSMCWRCQRCYNGTVEWGVTCPPGCPASIVKG